MWWWFLAGLAIGESDHDSSPPPPDTAVHYYKDSSLCKPAPQFDSYLDRGHEVCCIRGMPEFVSACKLFDETPEK